MVELSNVIIDSRARFNQHYFSTCH